MEAVWVLSFLAFLLFLSHFVLAAYLWAIHRSIERFRDELTKLPEGAEISYEISGGDEWLN